MKYDYTVIQDGQTYLAGEDVPEMGSLICVKKYGNIRDYEQYNELMDVGKEETDPEGKLIN